jgi:hypothetical protein
MGNDVMELEAWCRGELAAPQSAALSSLECGPWEDSSAVDRESFGGVARSEAWADDVVQICCPRRPSVRIIFSKLPYF